MQEPRGRGPRKSRPDPEAAQRAVFREKVADLERNMGLTRPLAVRVARTELGLSEAVETMARRDRVEALMRRHDFTRALASQIALGQADLEFHLRKQRLKLHLADYADRSILDEGVASGELLGVGLHGKRQLRVRVVEVKRFEVVLERDGTTTTEHKLQMKYACKADDLKKLSRGLKWDAERRNEPVEPIERPQDRYALSDRRLFALVDRDVTVTLTLMEGEMLRGRLIWLSRFELGLRCKGKLEVTVFRHAIADLTEA